PRAPAPPLARHSFPTRRSSDLTPWSATHIGKVIAERTEIPPGVVNIVASSDHLTGEILSSDPRVDLVTFTGSTATGRRIMECASDRKSTRLNSSHEWISYAVFC